jgi:hypothetical protein
MAGHGGPQHTMAGHTMTGHVVPQHGRPRCTTAHHGRPYHDRPCCTTAWQATVHHSTPLSATLVHTTKYGTKQLINYHALHVQQGMSGHCTEWHNTCSTLLAHHYMHGKVLRNRENHLTCSAHHIIALHTQLSSATDCDTAWHSTPCHSTAHTVKHCI